jgi:hypothetical protein
MPVRDLVELLRRQGEALGPNSWNGTSRLHSFVFPSHSTQISFRDRHRIPPVTPEKRGFGN